MANSVGSAANSTSRRCFTLVKVTTPIPAKAELPTKFAVAEKHMLGLPCENYTHRRRNQAIPCSSFLWSPYRAIRDLPMRRLSGTVSALKGRLTWGQANRRPQGWAHEN